MRVQAPGELECYVYVEREGVLSRVGHDVKLRVRRAWVEATPESVSAGFDAASLEVACAMVNGREDTSALSARDCVSIAENVAREVLDAARHPEIAFVSTSVEDERVEGTLTLRGVARRVVADVTRTGDRVQASCVLHQPDFGIRVYSAMLGALRVKPVVRVVVGFPTSGSLARA